MFKRKGNTHLLDEIVEYGDVFPAFHVFSFILRLLLPLGLLGVLVERAEEVLAEDKVLVAVEVVDLDVGEVGVHAQAEVGGQRPGGGGPREEGGGGVGLEGEGDRYYR